MGVYKRGFVHVRSLALVILTVLAATPVSLADGMAWKMGKDWSSFRLADENEQIAVIAHVDGRQHMLLAVDLEITETEMAGESGTGRTDPTVWIVPVKGTDPNDVGLALFDVFPRFSGFDPVQKARGDIKNWWGGGVNAPLLAGMCLLPALGRPRSNLGDATSGTMIEQWGIRSAAVSAPSREALLDYFAEQGHPVSNNSLASLQPYFDGSHLFIVTWIASIEEFETHFETPWREAVQRDGFWPSLYVSFPCEQPFFPMRPTSVYGKVEIPIRLMLIGAWTLESDSILLVQTAEVRHYRETFSISENLFPVAFAEAIGAGETAVDGVYTRVRLDTTADAFTDDLFFSPTSPRGWAYASVVSSICDSILWTVVTTLCAILVLSWCSGGICGYLFFKEPKRFACISLWNLLTVVGLLFVILRILRQEEMLVKEAPTKSALSNGILFVVLFSLVYVALGLGMMRVLTFPLV